MLAVHPVRHRRVTVGTLGLCDLVLVVREDVVYTARMQIETLAEVLRAHRRTLDVPSRKASAPRRLPGERATGLGLLPEREVGGIALVRIEIGPHALPERLADIAGEPSVAVEALDREIDRTLDLVREAARDEPLDDGDHLGNVIGRAREVGRRKDAQTPLVAVKTRFVELGDLLRRLALGEGGGNDLVLAPLDRVLPHMPDVGDVLDRDDGVAEVLERSAEPVREQV